jgi:YesN/AraC family two-component response regulator
MEELHEAVAAMVRTLSLISPETASFADSADDLPLTAPMDANTVIPREAEPEEESDAGGFVARAALRYIQEHCTEHLSLADVADNVYVSQWHLSKLINRHARQSFFDLLNHYRIQRSQAMLANPMYKVSEVAYAIGYADVAHFSRIFKKVTGQTPMAFRNGLR